MTPPLAVELDAFQRKRFPGPRSDVWLRLRLFLNLIALFDAARFQLNFFNQLNSSCTSSLLCSSTYPLPHRLMIT